MKIKRQSPWSSILFSIFSLLLILLLAGFVLAVPSMSVLWFISSKRWAYFAEGILIMAILLFTLYYIGRYRYLSAITQQFLLFHRFNHEMAHALVALLSGAGVASFQVSPNGGAVQAWRITHTTFIVALAPYIFSLPLLILFMFEMISPKTGNIFCALMGAAWCYYSLCTLAGMSPAQSDFNGIAYPVCLIWIVSALIMTTLIVVASIVGGQTQVSMLLSCAVEHTIHLLQRALDAIVRLLH